MHIMKDGKPFNGTITVDGYLFGDRQLEGLEFDLDVKDGEIQNDTFRCHNKIYEEYFEQFNRNYWLKRCVEYVENGRGDNEEVEIDHMDDEILNYQEK